MALIQRVLQEGTNAKYSKRFGPECTAEDRRMIMDPKTRTEKQKVVRCGNKATTSLFLVNTTDLKNPVEEMKLRKVGQVCDTHAKRVRGARWIEKPSRSKKKVKGEEVGSDVAEA